MSLRWRTIRRMLRERSGLTLLEVTLALAIFLIGSVSIVSLFVAASLLHSDAMKRRTASFIAEELLAEVQSMPLRDVFATTSLAANIDATVQDMPVASVRMDRDPLATFDEYPRPDIGTSRSSGPLLIETEWIWYDRTNTSLNPPYEGHFQLCDRGLGRSLAAPHVALKRVLQPRSWYYVLENDLAAGAGGVVQVKGDPTAAPRAPGDGFIVVDGEWIRYESCDATGFTVATDREGNPERGFADTADVDHRAGTPVTVAREHPRYPGYYYTVQFYPTNATGQGAKVAIAVGYGVEQRARAHFFHSIYSPSRQ